ncbi:MAG: hypothetical protein JJE21_07015 [Spirochaetaceae bacterium]|nr:hypothetical protein [Spirochaetaceae bacterium]
MGRIKSAWEIALEKTADLKVDTKKINHDKILRKGSQITGSYINNIDYTIEEFKTTFDAEENKKTLVEGIVKIVLIGVKLPDNELFESKIEKLKDICKIVQPESETIPVIFEQMVEFFRQYENHQKQLIDQMKQQFAPSLAQKEEKLRQQYGPDYKLQPEQDKEFMQLLNENLSKLDEHYNGSLKEVKQNIESELLLNY